MSAPENPRMDLPAIKRKVWRTSRIRTYEYLSREATVYAAIDAAYPYIKAEHDVLVVDLRALIEQWRAEADKLQAAALTHPYGSTGSVSCTVLAGAARGHADELERAMGGGA